MASLIVLKLFIGKFFNPPCYLFKSNPGLLLSFLRGGTEMHKVCKAALAARRSKLP